MPADLRKISDVRVGYALEPAHHELDIGEESRIDMYLTGPVNAGTRRDGRANRQSASRGNPLTTLTLARAKPGHGPVGQSELPTPRQGQITAATTGCWSFSTGAASVRIPSERDVS